MKLFKKRGARRYKPSWLYKTKGRIWRLLFSEGRFIAGEDRTDDAENVIFFCLDGGNGKELWSVAEGKEGWWTSIEGVYGDRLYLHSFARPDLPNPKHIKAIEIETGRVLWERPDLTFLYSKGETVTAEKEESGIKFYHLLDTGSGETRETITDRERIIRERKESRAEDPHRHLRFPETYTASDESHRIFQPVISLIEEQEKTEGPAEVLLHKNNLIVSYHVIERGAERGNPALEQRLVIYDSGGRGELYQEILITGASMLVSDSFMIKGDVLYYIRNKSELVAITLKGNS